MNALCFVLYQNVSMQWTCQLVVKTRTPLTGELMVLLHGGGGVALFQGGSYPIRGGWINPCNEDI